MSRPAGGGERKRAAASSASPSAGRDAQVAAMVRLLDDRNPVVVRRCREALVAVGEPARPALAARLAEVAARVREPRRPVRPGGPDDGADFLMREEVVLRRVLADLDGDGAEAALAAHLSGAAELEEGCRLVGRLVDGGGAADELAAALDALAARVRERLAGSTDPDAGIDALRRAFRGVANVPPDLARPIDALLHAVTGERRGMPLAISMAWLLVARRTGVPLVGVDMPGHFLVRLGVPDRLLVLDPFHGGRVMDLDVCRRFLAAQGAGGRDLLSLDASDRAMLLRTLRNVVHLSEAWGEVVLAARCRRLLEQAPVP